MTDSSNQRWSRRGYVCRKLVAAGLSWEESNSAIMDYLDTEPAAPKWLRGSLHDPMSSRTVKEWDEYFAWRKGVQKSETV